ncbi:hypothetical protein [Psychrobacter sp. DAB_AL32B]|uniref:hypothetical protein n=1 Tax=Psychrobacter sp. DAB_AL32B TaxID=1028414 RepID=UPI000B7DFFFC|nr:hypothetical protein [Psychrobacter sp. DAB_AL32B]OXL21493.1 hypothetical protein CAN34_09310 [Psychrobacter sp. DAB_AL32B]
MKLIKLTAISAAILASTAALAADPIIVVDGDEAVVYEAEPVAVAYEVQPAYAYDADASALRNTTGAVVGGTKTLFQTVTHPAAVSAEIGTLGYGANIAWGVNDKTELQAGWSGMNFDGDRDLNANDSWINWDKALGDGYGNYQGTMDYDVDFSNPYIGVQMRPFANNFTVGAGTMVPRNKLAATLTADTGSTANVSIDGVDYQVDTATIRAENKNKLAPYATIGYRPNITQNWGVFGELGAAYMGKMDAEVTGVTGTSANIADFAAAAEKEIKDKDVWYPIVKVGATYRF